MPVSVTVLTDCEATSAVDNFNYTANPISTNDGSWTDSVVTGHSALRTDGSVCLGDDTVAGTYSGYKNNAGPYGPNFVAMAIVNTVMDPAADGTIYLYLLDGAGPYGGSPNGYAVEWRLRGSSNDEFRVKRLDAGVETTLSSGTFQEASSGDKWAAVRNGNDIEVWWKTGSSWTYMATATDSTYTANKRVGLLVNNASITNTARLDFLQINNIASAVDLTGAFIMA